MATNYRFVFILALAFLVANSYSAPTLNPTTKSAEVSTDEKSTSAQNESSSPQPTAVMEDTTEKVMASENSTEETSTTEVVTVETSAAKPSNTTQNTTDASLKNVTASTNATNTTEVEEYDGPSSILYPLCSNYLGVSNRKIVKDEQMWASSTLEVSDLRKYINSTLEELEHDSNETFISNFTITGNKTAPHDGRLGNTAGSWCASVDPLDVNGHHLIVDLGKVYILEAVITQGRSDSDNWVTEYTLEYSSNKRKWSHLKDGRRQKVFKGNKDRDSIAVGSFPHRIAARYLKFTPKFFHGKLMCMRVEAVGCHPDAVNVAKNQPVQQSNPNGNSTSSPGVVDGEFVPKLLNGTCTGTQNQSNSKSPWLRIDLRRSYQVQEIFISNQDHDDGYDMRDFEVRVGNSLDNEGNDNARCSPLYNLLPGHIGTVVCKNGTLGRYVNIRVDRDDFRLSLCEVAVIGVAETIVKLGLNDIANSLRTGAVVDKAGEMAGDVVGGLIGQLQNQLQGRFGAMLLGQGVGVLNNMKGQSLGMLNNLGGQGVGMLNNFKDQGVAMANKMKDQGSAMANKLKDQGMEMGDKVKEQTMEAANKVKEQTMEAANKVKEQGVEMANKAKEQGKAMANDLSNQGQAVVGDMQGQVNQQQDKFKKKLKEMLDKGKEYLEVGKEEMEKFKKKGYIETGKEYMDIGLGMMMDGVAFIQAKLMESLSNIAGDMSKQITTLSEYDTSDIKGLLDDVDPVPVRNFVEEAKPKIGEFIDEMQKMAKKYLDVGTEKAMEAKDEIESEADNAKNDATGLGKNVAGKATATGKNMANKAKAVGMHAANKAKEVGMGALDKAKSLGMGALEQAKGMGMGAFGDLKQTGMGALGQAKGLGMGVFGQLQQAGMGALGNLQGLGQGMLAQLSSAGKELLEKVKDMKPSTVKEMQQIQMLQQLKKMKQVQELEKHLEVEQDSQWKEFEKLNKEMEDEINMGEVKLEGEEEFLKDNDAPDLGGSM